MPARMTEHLRRVPAGAVLLAVAGLVLAVLCLHQLTASEVRVAGTSGAAPRLFVANLPRRAATLCQTQSSVPREAGRIRLTVGTYGRPGPRLDVSFRRAGRTLGRGRLAAGWSEGVIDIPLRARAGDLADVRLCIRSAGGARLAVAGEPAGDPAVVAGAVQPGRISVTGLTEGKQSTLSLLPELARRLGRGNAAFVGPWTLVAIGLLTLLALALGALAVLRTAAPGEHEDGDEPAVPADAPPASAPPPPGRAARARPALARIPLPGRALAGAALALGLAWALLTPPFQVADETSHVAYVQYLAETGKLPKEVAGTAPFSPQENAILGAIGFSRIIGRTGEKVPATASEERYLRSVERGDEPAAGAGNATTASGNPPLYYLLQTPVYLATSSASLLTQLLAMRLLSVLFTAFSVLLAFLFLRELLPRSPWTWTAGGLACAFQPVLGYVGSGVNPDSLLFLCATGTLFAAARVVRRGLTLRRALLLGAFVLGGLLTKPLFLSLIPAAGLALLYGAWRGGRPSWRALAAGGAVVVLPMLVYTVLASGPLDHPYFAVATNVASGATGSGATDTSISKELSFLLQQFLPRLPFLTDFVPGDPIEDTWINGLVGVFGWVDYQFPIENTHFAVRLFEALLILAAVALVTARRRIVQHLPLAAVCLVALGGLLGAVGVTDYQAFISNGARFQQARYVLPLLALYGGLFALAAKGLGPVLGRVAVPALWVLVGLHTVAAMVLTANRYYL